MDDECRHVSRPFGKIAMAPDIVRVAFEIGRACSLAAHAASFQKHQRASRERPWVQTSSPFSPDGTGWPSSFQTSMARPSPGALDFAAPARAASGFPSTKQETISVPPEIECTARISGLDGRHKRNGKALRRQAAEPVEVISVRSAGEVMGRYRREARPCGTASIYFADSAEDAANVLVAGIIEQDVAIGMERRAVEQSISVAPNAEPAR